MSVHSRITLVSPLHQEDYCPENEALTSDEVSELEPKSRFKSLIQSGPKPQKSLIQLTPLTHKILQLVSYELDIT